jgi:hypothetical protein
MKTVRLDQLTDAWRDGALTEEEAAELSQILRDSEEARRFFRAEAQMHGLLHSAVMAASVEEASSIIAPQTVRRSWPQRPAWSPIKAAAAGLVIGLFSASVVWALAVQRAEPPVKRRALMTESFESGVAPRVSGMPRRADEWAGDVTAIAGEEAGLRPAQGSRMLRFLRVDQGRPAAAPAMSSDVWRVVDLRKTRESEWQGGTLEVRALLARSSPPKAPAQASFALTVVTWSGEASEAPEQWRRWQQDRMSMSGWAIQCVKAGAPGEWVRALMTMPLPAQADFAVVCISAMPGEADGTLAGHFADGIEVNLVARSAAPSPQH